MAAELSDSLLASQPAVGRPRCTALQLGLSALVLLLSAAFVLIFVVAPGSQLTGPDGQGCIDHITLQCDWDIGMQFAGVLVAKDRGFYSDAGLCVDLNADPATEDSVVERVQKSDGIAVGISEGAMLLEALSNQEAELVAMASVLPTSPLGWMSLHNSSASVSDRLNGASIAVHPDGVLPLSVALSSHGLTLSSVNVVRASDTLEPLINGSVDLMQGYLMDEFITLRQLYPNASIILAVDNGDVSYSQVLFTTVSTFRRSPAALAGFINATRQGWRYALSHPADTVRVVRERESQRSSVVPSDTILGAQLKAMAKLVGEDPLAPMLLSRWDQEQAVLLDHRALTHPIQSLSGFVLNL